MHACHLTCLAILHIINLSRVVYFLFFVLLFSVAYDVDGRNLSDVDEDGQMDVGEFVVAMYLITLKVEVFLFFACALSYANVFRLSWSCLFRLVFRMLRYICLFLFLDRSY